MRQIVYLSTAAGRLVSAARASSAPLTNVTPLVNTMSQLGMPLYGCQTPDGYKNTQDAWLNPDALTRRIAFATALAQGRLPLLLWAYPREFVDPNAAGQVNGSPQRFTAVSGASHLLLLTQGYAILDDPSMPIVGTGETANDTYVEQLVASAKAAVDKVVSMGVADPARHQRAARRGQGALRHRARLHPRRGDACRGPARAQERGQVPRGRKAPARGQGVRRQGRRRDQLPLRGVSVARRARSRSI